MSLNTVTLTWNLVDLRQNGVGKSKITVTPAVQVTFGGLDLIIPELARSVIFTGGTGSMAGIIATDNAGMSPSAFEYIITVTDAVDFRFTTIQPFATPINFANGATQDLSVLLAAVL
jgi:hypothetical protein